MRAVVLIASVLALTTFVSATNIVHQRRLHAAMNALAAGIPEVKIGAWQAPTPSDCRSPCPALNTLANHGMLPRNGRKLNYDMLKRALIDVLGLSDAFGTVFAHAATKKFADPKTNEFDLCSLLTNLHTDVPASGSKGIEHSASLSREDRSDFTVNSNPQERTPSAAQVGIVLASSTDGQTITVPNFVNAREKLWAKSFAARPFLRDDKLHTQEAIIADVEGCLLLGSLAGNSNEGKFKISKEYAKSILLNERFPNGWKRSSRILGIPDLLLCLAEQKVAWAANEFTTLTAVAKHWFSLLW